MAIFAPLGIYVFGIQLMYDKTDVTQNPWLKSLFFMVALIAGSATYDFAKRALFMPKEHFEKFFTGLCGAWLAIFFLLLFAVLSALILNWPYLAEKIPSWVGYMVYFFSIVCIPWFIIDLTKAIEAAAK